MFILRKGNNFDVKTKRRYEVRYIIDIKKMITNDAAYRELKRCTFFQPIRVNRYLWTAVQWIRVNALYTDGYVYADTLNLSIRFSLYIGLHFHTYYRPICLNTYYHHISYSKLQICIMSSPSNNTYVSIPYFYLLWLHVVVYTYVVCMSISHCEVYSFLRLVNSKKGLYI